MLLHHYRDHLHPRHPSPDYRGCPYCTGTLNYSKVTELVCNLKVGLLPTFKLCINTDLQYRASETTALSLKSHITKLMYVNFLFRILSPMLKSMELAFHFDEVFKQLRLMLPSLRSMFINNVDNTIHHSDTVYLRTIVPQPTQA